MVSRKAAGPVSAVTDNGAPKKLGEQGASSRLKKSEKQSPHPLDVLFERSCILADRVRCGELGFIDAVDFSYSAADFAGLIHRFGDDKIQRVLAAAFIGAKDGVHE